MRFFKLMTTKSETDVVVNPLQVTRLVPKGVDRTLVCLSDGTEHEAMTGHTELVRLLEENARPSGGLSTR